MAYTLQPYEPYNNCYHFVGHTKSRIKFFETEEMRTALSAAIIESVQVLPNTKVLAVATAYTHFHALIQSNLPTYVIGKYLYGGTSRIMRSKFPALLELDKNRLWFGRAIMPIENERHFKNSMSYITRHNPDNTKKDD